MGSESDTFMFDVTNGIQSLHGLEFVIEIIPKLIPLEIRDFAVMEGDHKMLTGMTLGEYQLMYIFLVVICYALLQYCVTLLFLYER